MATPSKLALPATRSAVQALESLIDVFWTATISIYSTRAQVLGIQQVEPAISQKDLAARFGFAGMKGGSTNVVTNALRDWGDIEDELNSAWLVQLCAVYEAWCENLADELATPSVGKDLQFPVRWANTVSDLGVSAGLSELLRASPVHKHVGHVDTDEALQAFRVFKETRNCLAHNDRNVDQKLVDAWGRCANAGWSSTDFRQPLPFRGAPVLNSRISVARYDLIGFSGLLQRLMANLEREIFVTRAYEGAYVRRWRGRSKPIDLSSDPAKRHKQIGGLAAKVGPKPSVSTIGGSYERLLKHQGLIRF